MNFRKDIRQPPKQRLRAPIKARCREDSFGRTVQYETYDRLICDMHTVQICPIVDIVLDSAGKLAP